MHSLDEPLDLKLSIPSLRAAKHQRPWGLGSPKGQALHQTAEDDVASSPDGLQPPSRCHGKREHKFSWPPTADLSPSPSPPGLDSPSGHPPGSPDRQSSGALLKPSASRDLHSLGYIDSLRSSFQLFLPLSSGGALPVSASAFLTPPKEKRLSPEAALQKQLVCRWSKCHRLFDLLQGLVDHVNDAHIRPEKDAGYCCHWEGCSRRGRGFNARYKMLIHIRTHTNEKPHRCPTCNKSFSRLENLKIHNRSHTGEKPYLCPYEGCSKRYSNSSDRFKHTRTHYVDKPYRCKMPGCPKRYTDPSSLRKHIKAHGHFLSPETPADPPLAAADMPSLGRAQILLPSPTALLGSHSLALPPAPLDLSTFACSGLGPAAMLAPLNLTKSPVLPPPFSAGSLGLPGKSLLAGTSTRAAAEGGRESTAQPAQGVSGSHRQRRSLGLQRCKEANERLALARLQPSADGLSLLPGGVLDLSSSMNPVVGSAKALPPGWVVIPTSSVLLKQAVVN